MSSTSAVIIDPPRPRPRVWKEVLFVSVFALWFLLFFIPIFLLVALLGENTLYILFILPVYAYFFYFTGDERNAQHTRRWDWFCNGFIMQTMSEYFQNRFISESKLDDRKTYVIGVHPHGILGFQCNPITSNLHRYLERVKSSHPRVCVASVLFMMPGIREFFLYQGYCNASKSTCRSILQSGQDCALIVGGSKEVLEAKPNTDVLYLKNRKGFIRLAMQCNSDVVPMYAFRHNDCYDQFLGFKRFQLKLINMFQALVPLFWGRWFSMVPFQVPVTIVLGKPIELPHVAEPTDQQVDEAHARYVDALTTMFEKWKSEAGYPPDRRLIIK